MTVTIAVKGPKGDFDLKYTNVASIDELVAMIRRTHPDITSLTIVVEGFR